MDCKEGMSDAISFQTGVHNAFAHASNFYMENEFKMFIGPYLNPDSFEETNNNNNQNDSGV